MTDDGLRERVRERYAALAVAAAGTISGSGSGSGGGGAGGSGSGGAGSGGCCGSPAPADADVGVAADGCCGSAGAGTATAGGDASVAGCCAGGSGTCCSGGAGTGGGDVFGSALYADGERAELPAAAVAASLGCGNPVAVADLGPGDRVLDLGSGGGIDVLLSARRVGPAGLVYGVDMTDEMLDLARANAAAAGAANVEFRKGTIEDVPLPDGAVDVVISNCVVNLSADKPAVLAEMFRVLAPGGRLGVSDVVAEDHVAPAERAERGTDVGCVAGALSRSEYLDGLAAAGFVGASVEFTHEVVPGMHGAIVRATKPA